MTGRLPNQPYADLVFKLRILIMYLYKKYTEANRNKQAEAFLELIHYNFTFVSNRHEVTGNRKQPSAMVYFVIGSEKTISAQNESSVYENEHTLKQDKAMSFPDAGREAVICV